MTTSLENHKIEHIQLDITNTPIQGIGGAPLVLSNNQISFSYDSTDFELDGNSLQIKDSGISHSNLLDLENDDHTQYHNNTRGDVRYYTQTLLDGGQLDSRYYTESESDAVFAPISKGVTNGDSHNHSGGDGAQISHTGLSDLDSNDHSQYLLVADIDDTPVNGETSAPISSNWAYDHVVAADPHTGYRLESADHTHQGSGAQAGQLDHGLALTGLSDDDHTIYALLAGRSGGQTLKGGTDSGDDLTLQSTNHATKGSILFGTSAYDEVNNRLGIGTSTPSSTLHVNGPITMAAADGTDNYSPALTQNVADDFSYNSKYLSHYGCGFHDYTGAGATGFYAAGYYGIDLFTGGQQRLTINNSGNVGIGAAPATIFDVNGDSIRIRTSQSPASNGAGIQGEIAWDSDYLYVCTATNTWKRVALTGGY